MPDLKEPIGPEDHIQGSPDAPVVLVEYGDFECPHCGNAYPIIKRVQQHFGPDLAFVYRHFPLIAIHPNAATAAETAEWAGSHGRFWEMHGLLFENQDRLSPLLFFALADTLGLDRRDLAIALEEGRFEDRVKRDMMSGARSGVQGTPTFFINGEMHTGSYAYEDLVEAIEQRRQGQLAA